MKISRHGSYKNHGRRSVNLDQPKFTWVLGDGSISINQSEIKDFTSDTTHSYHIQLSCSEVEDILNVLAEAAAKNPKAFETHYPNSLKALIQLVVTVSGVKV